LENVTLKNAETELVAAVYRPSKEGRSAGIVVAPGGLGRGDLDAYQWAGERLAAAGYVTMVATYSTSSPRSDSADLTLAVDWLTASSIVDSYRIAVFGHSRGGLAGLMLAASDTRVRAAVSIATPVDLATYVRGVSTFAPSAAAGIVQFIGGMPEEVPGVYEMLNAQNLAARIAQPVLLIHGLADMRVPVEYPQRLEMALRDAGNEGVRLELIPGMGHFLELGTLGYQFDRVTDLATAWLQDSLDRPKTSP
jgi:dipeptidyl aminopeptidase/acylaminoacyl peptidase